jgi:2',3'-cyclic-nucleotide 2'-phosphodiesterase/3'-nucleotidase
MVAGSMPGYNFDIAQGVSYTLDLLKPVGQRVENLSLARAPAAGRQKLRSRSATTAVNGGGGFDMFKGKPIVYRSELPTRDLLMDELKKLKTVGDVKDDNWRLVPAWAADPAAAARGSSCSCGSRIVPQGLGAGRGDRRRR